MSQLREIHGGLWEDVPWDDLPVLFAESYDSWLNTPHELQMPKGESMREFQKRLLEAVDKICEENEGKNICIVTHGTAIKAMMCRFLGLGLEGFNCVDWYDNASITIVDVEDGRYKVVLEGDNSHLGETGTIHKQDWWKELKRREKNADKRKGN